MLHNPIVVMLIAALAAWIFGAIWYTALSKPYQRALGLDPEQSKGQKMPLAPMLTSFACEVVMAFVLYQLLTGFGVAGLQGGAVTGLILGIAFMATTTLVNNMFQGSKPMLSVINCAHWIGVAVIEGAVLAALA